MVKRMTFLQLFLVAALFVIICAYGMAAAKEKLMLKYLPVDYDIETVSQVNNSTTNPLHLYQTNNPETDLIIGNHALCLTCRDYDRYGGSQCPDCCLYNNNTSIYCTGTDPECQNPEPRPFSTTCANCTNTFVRNPSTCPDDCAKYPQAINHCLRKGCPGTTMPVDSSCKEYPVNSGIWYCKNNGRGPGQPCASRNETFLQSCNYTYATAYGSTTAATPFECTAANVSCPRWIYNATDDFKTCVANCTQRADLWEDLYYEYNNATLGKKICPTGSNCTSGFNHNCDVAKCRAKIDFGCGNFTQEMCASNEAAYQEMLLGTIADTFVEIDPKFQYKFVARSGERYMISWQVLCDVKKGDQKYNLYTMVKVWDQDQKAGDKPVYQSIIHQKALGSTFYINAQTGMDEEKAPALKRGRGKAYIVKLYYFLPNDGSTELQVDVELMQMIFYRTKN